MNNQQFSQLYELTSEGLDVFADVMIGVRPDDALKIYSLAHAVPISGTIGLTVSAPQTAKAMATSILAAFGGLAAQELAGRIGLWAWLTYLYRDFLFTTADKVRKTGERHKWYPSEPNDWLKSQRHLVRMPVLLYAAFGDDADHLLCGRPGVPGEVREQLTSQQDMFAPDFVRAGKNLYYDPEKLQLRSGAGGKGRGASRRLAKVRKQLDVTWDMTGISHDRILRLLPTEFDKFKGVPNVGV